MLEPNNIYNIDCLQGLRQMPDGCVDLIVTDPPYDIETKGAGLYKQDDKRYIHELEGMSSGFDDVMLDELCRVMKKINIYIFCSQKQILPLLNYFVTQRHCNYNILTWHKTNPVPACGNKYLTDTEFILFFREKGVKIYGEYNTKFTYYVTPLNKEDKKKYNHPTIKPLKIVRNLIINSSLEGDLVLDPFTGSGTTAVAAKTLGRKYIGFEINTEYVEIANNRLAEGFCN
jgi:DNA modification methylase